MMCMYPQLPHRRSSCCKKTKHLIYRLVYVSGNPIWFLQKWGFQFVFCHLHQSTYDKKVSPFDLRLKNECCLEWQASVPYSSFWLPYSLKQKYVLLFRKSDFLFFKVSNTNKPQIFLETKLLLFLKLESWNFRHRID